MEQLTETRRKRVVYDIETIKGCFTYTDINIDTKQISQYVIHPQRNQLTEFIKYYKTVGLGIGYNNQAFDYPVLHSMILTENYWNEMLNKKYYDIKDVILDIYKKASSIIEEQNDPNNFFKAFGIKHEDEYVTQLDLFKLWHYNNKAKMTSLKALEVSMNLDNVMECDIPFDKEEISLEELDSILEYNLNDVKATYAFYLKSKEKIKLRHTIKKKYGLHCYSWNNGKLGEELILKLYCDETGKNPWEVKKQRTEYVNIDLKDCIPNNIVFNTQEFNNILKAFTKKKVVIADVQNKVAGAGEVGAVNFKSCIIDYGIGGIHGVTEKGIYESNKKYIIKSLDVSSLYPNLPIVYRLYIKHLGIVFLEVYRDNIVNVRMAEKKKDKKDRDLAIIDGFKEAANIPYGKSGDKNSFLFDYNYTFSTTVAGQLLLSMLAEQLGEIPDMQLLMVNTDGMEVLIERKYEELYNTICLNWQKYTGLELEFVDYEKMWIGDVNNYGCVSTDGKIKNKGRFEVDKVIGSEPAYYKDNSFRIVPLALQYYFGKGISVETTIKNHLTNTYEDVDNFGIFDFCGRQKFNKDSYGETLEIILNDEKDLRPELQGTKQQKVTRYYISNRGNRFIKRYVGGKSQGKMQLFHKNHNVTIFNRYEKKETLKDYDIDISFYLKECYKEIHSIEKKQQLTLF